MENFGSAGWRLAGGRAGLAERFAAGLTATLADAGLFGFGAGDCAVEEESRTAISTRPRVAAAEVEHGRKIISVCSQCPQVFWRV
jgi:hypothetical protein